MCEQCEGKGEIFLIDVWAFSRAYRESKKAPEGLPKIGPIACPWCRTEEAVGTLKALLDKHGQPFGDKPVTGYTHWRDPDGKPIASVTTE